MKINLIISHHFQLRRKRQIIIYHSSRNPWDILGFPFVRQDKISSQLDSFRQLIVLCVRHPQNYINSQNMLQWQGSKPCFFIACFNTLISNYYSQPPDNFSYGLIASPCSLKNSLNPSQAFINSASDYIYLLKRFANICLAIFTSISFAQWFPCPSSTMNWANFVNSDFVRLWLLLNSKLSQISCIVTQSLLVALDLPIERVDFTLSFLPCFSGQAGRLGRTLSKSFINYSISCWVSRRKKERDLMEALISSKVITLTCEGLDIQLLVTNQREPFLLAACYSKRPALQSWLYFSNSVVKKLIWSSKPAFLLACQDFLAYSCFLSSLLHQSMYSQVLNFSLSSFSSLKVTASLSFIFSNNYQYSIFSFFLSFTRCLSNSISYSNPSAYLNNPFILSHSYLYFLFYASKCRDLTTPLITIFSTLYSSCLNLDLSISLFKIFLICSQPRLNLDTCRGLKSYCSIRWVTQLRRQSTF